MSGGDNAARRRALDPQTSFCVTAPAGSGKTELLTQRILALLPTVDRPEKILAITFTRKAAAEMRGRLMTKLDEARRQVPVQEPHEQETRALALAALGHAEAQGWSLEPEQFNVSTIDGFCADLVGQMPVLSGVGGAVEVTEQDQPLFEQAVAQLFEALGSDTTTGDDLRELLLHFNNDWEALRQLLVALLRRRGDWAGSLGQHNDPDIASRTLLATVNSLVVSVLRRLEAECQPWLGELEELANYAASERGYPDIRLDAQASSLASWQWAAQLLLTGTDQWRKPGGVTVKQGFPPKTEEKQRLQTLLEELGEGAVPDSLLELRALPVMSDDDVSWRLVLRLSRLLPVLQAQLLLVFKREGRVDFTHIALAATDALGSDEAPTDLALRLDYQIEHLLVDEFQDTSRQQYELLTKLTRGWAEHNAGGNAPRTVFIVGDGMQSIYGFRYAYVGLFLEARVSGLAGLAMEPLELTRNFRSQAGVVDWVNRVFARILPRQDVPERGEVSHTRAEAVHPPLSDEPVSVHLFEDDDDPGVREADWLAGEIATLRETDPEASIAILVRARNHVHNLIVALQRRGLSFIARDLQKIQRSPAVMDLLSLTRWLANPADNVAALALLRAPFCGLGLAEIHDLLAAQPRPFSLRAALQQAPELLSGAALQRARALLIALDWADARRDRLALAIWVEQVWLRLGGPQTLDGEGAADAQRFFDLLWQAEQLSLGLDLEWLEARLDRLYASHNPTGARIELMTLHKAKGLQFDYVFMPAMDRTSGGSKRELLRWHYHPDGNETRLLIAADDRQKQGPTLYNYLNWLQRRRETAETVRLLYVGVTRACKRAWLSGGCQIEQDEASTIKWPGPSTPLGLLKEAVAAQVHLHSADTSGHWVEEAVAVEPAPGVGQPALWRLPAEALPAPGETAGPDLEHENTGAAARGTGTSVAARGNTMERLMGVTIHRALELLSLRRVLPSTVDDELRGMITFALREGGLREQALEDRVSAAVGVLDRTLADERGQWILAQHQDAHSELELMVVGPDGAPKTQIIDRTFVDDTTGERWIIDYKTSAPGADETETEFLTREGDHYASQLASYRDTMAAFDPDHPCIHTALYFPGTGLWLPVNVQGRA